MQAGVRRAAALGWKAIRLASRTSFARAMVRHRVGAAIEHLPVIRHCAPATLIDVGANKGQFSLATRALRPEACIIAFEPLGEAADVFEALFAGDARTKLHRVAIGDVETTAEFHVTDRRDSSSLLKPGRGQSAAFGVEDELTIEVPVRRLGSCISLPELTHPILMKIDVQGAELAVLRGCDDLEAVDFIYAELSYVELYEGQPLFDEVTAYLSGRGFAIAGVFNQVVTREFGPTQADVLFGRPVR